MEIKRLTLTNVGQFESLSVLLAPSPAAASNVTVFVGNNGSGKTTILNSVATALSWWVARIRSEKGSGSALPERGIRNQAPSAAIEIEVADLTSKTAVDSPSTENSYRWTITKARKGRRAEQPTQLIEATRLAESYRELLSVDENTNLPLIAYYPVERLVFEIPLKLRGSHQFQQVDGYDNALSQGVDFRRFFEWFREREDAENETNQEFINQLVKLGPDAFADKLPAMQTRSEDVQLKAVRHAIAAFMPGFRNLRVRRKPRLHMSIEKRDEVLDVAQLSQGEKSMMALVGDIARRLAMLNPGLENPLEGDGVVLIDEVDQHLHPAWQRTLVSRLTATFPNCQFLLTTHSALVISDVKDVLVYLLEDGELESVTDLYGQDVNTVLLGVMNTGIRTEHIEKRLNDLRDALHDLDIDRSKTLLKELETLLPPSHLELAKARLLMGKAELRVAKNSQG